MRIEPAPSSGSYLPETYYTDEHYDAAQCLTVKQRIFVDQYLLYFDKNAAAKAAGFKGVSAGRNLLTKPYISRCIQLAIERRLSSLNIKQEHVIDEVANLAITGMGDFLTADDDGNVNISFIGKSKRKLDCIKKFKTTTTTRGKGDDTYTVTTVDFELYDRIATLKLLGQHTGLFSDTHKVELTGKDGGPIRIESVEIQPIKSGTFLEYEEQADGSFSPPERITVIDHNIPTVPYVGAAE